MSTTRDGIGSRRSWLMLVLVVGATAIGLLMLREVAPDTLRSTATQAWSRLQEAPPLVFFTTMALVCLLPFPITLFYMAAGPLFGIVPAILWIVPALAVNQLLGHAIAGGFLRPRIEALIEGRGYTVPRVTKPADQSLFTVAVRITPGFPYFLQNLVLGVAGIERKRYILISVPVQMIYAVGFVVLGKSAMDGEFGIGIGAIGLIFVVSLGARWLRGRMRNARSLGGGPSPGPSESSGE
ncbi:MAG: hypothetical protein JRF61_07140 [Deltaproteobacteria bacterium]|nr:hypothetical protein [Deltaproteobacteria bacterium]